MLQVSIDRNYFKKSLNDYSDYRSAQIRELCQNSIDAGSTNIKFSIDNHSEGIKLTCQNDGAPMDYGTIVNKLMNVGGTTKTGSGEDGNVGGFGVASVIIYMAHHSYTITSGEWIVTGAGGQFSIDKSETFFSGTKSEITIESTDPCSEGRRFYREIKKFASYAQWNGTFSISYEGETIRQPCALHKGYFRREFGFGRLYTNKQHSNLLIFRINGIPMFTKYIAYDGCAIFEANNSSMELMTSNRDGLKYTYQMEIDDVIRRFSSNLDSVLNREPTCEIYGNTLVGVDNAKKDINEPTQDETQESMVPVTEKPPEHENMPSETRSNTTYAAYDGLPNEDLTYTAYNMTDPDDTNTDDTLVDDNKTEQVQNPTHFAQKYMVLNESGMTTPASTRPDTMSKYCQRLLQIWIRLLHTTYCVNEKNGNFAVGFCLGDAIAKYTRRNGIDYYLINPFDIVQQDASRSRSFKRKYHLVKDREDLIMSAVHEFGHLTNSYHDERYAAVLTTLAAVAMKNMKEYKKCFR